MKKNITKKSHNFDKWLIAEIIGFILIGVILAASWYRFQLNPDGVSYISIAEKYANFDFRHAVNGYWGPLFSILLVPFLWAGVDPIIASKLLNVLLGAGIMYIFYYLLTTELKLDQQRARLFVLGLFPTLLVWIMPGPITPDVLMVFMLLLEIVVLCKALRHPSNANLALLGLMGFGLYLTKYFGLYLFIAQLTTVLLLRAVNQKRLYPNVIAWLKAMSVFVLMVLPVVVVLSLKYNHVTVSTTGSYNQGILAPQNAGIPIHPVVATGPFTPPNDTAYSAWEDPSNLPVPHWSPLSSLSDFKYFASLVYSNTKLARDIVVSFGALVVVGFILLLVYLITSFRSLNSEPLIICLALSSLFLIGGFLSLTTEARYIWAVVPFALLAVARFCLDYKIVKRTFYLTGGLLLAFSFWISGQALYDSRNVGIGVYEEAKQISRFVPEDSKVNSDTFSSIFTCMFADLRCYGLIAPSGNLEKDNELYSGLKKSGVSYYIDYGTAKSPATVEFLKKHATKVESISPTTTIYKYR